VIVEAPAVKVGRRGRIWRIECDARCSHINSLPIPRLAFSEGNPRLKGMTRKQLVLSTLGGLPDDATIADFEAELRILKALDEADADIDHGGTKPHEEVKSLQLEEVRLRRSEVLSGKVEGIPSQQVRDEIASLLKSRPPQRRGVASNGDKNY